MICECLNSIIRRTLNSRSFCKKIFQSSQSKSVKASRHLLTAQQSDTGCTKVANTIQSTLHYYTVFSKQGILNINPPLPRRYSQSDGSKRHARSIQSTLLHYYDTVYRPWLLHPVVTVVFTPSCSRSLTLLHPVSCYMYVHLSPDKAILELATKITA